MKNLAIAIGIAAATLPAAHAAGFDQIVAAKSNATFAYKQMGVAMNGSFHKTAFTLAFDPAAPSAGSARATIDVAGIDAGSNDANESLAGKAWFDAQSYPKASFVSSAIRAVGGNRYEATGKLTIKGHAHDVTLPFTFARSGNTGVIDGQFAIKRLDYGIGTGEWADVGTVADEVQIRFHLVATQGGAKP